MRLLIKILAALVAIPFGICLFLVVAAIESFSYLRAKLNRLLKSK